MSYYTVMGLEKEPFSTSPDPAFFYGSRQHRAALANILIELRLQRGLNVLLGDIGTGKTTLGRKLVQMLSDRKGFVFHMVLNPAYQSEEHFFDSLVRRMGIHVKGERPSVVDYCECLEAFLYKEAVEKNKTVVLIIDEAHKLNEASLEALRILLNYETNERKLLQLVLMGQTELLATLDLMPNLRDRVSALQILKPLSFEETKQMILFRLTEAGYTSPICLFSDKAIHEIFQSTRGYPRKILLMCHRALRELVMRDMTTVNRNLICDLIEKEKNSSWTQENILLKSAY